MEILNKILELARKKSMNEQDLCRILGLSKSGIYNWKKGQGEPTSSHLKILAETFEVSLDYLIGLSEDPTPPKKVLTQDDKLRIEISKLTPDKYKQAEQFVEFLKTQEEFSKELSDIVHISKMKPHTE